MRQIRLVSGFITVGVWTLLSRILGFVRDVMIAAILGAGPAADRKSTRLNSSHSV